MMKFNREEGLTLIELLITISVLAIVSAIALPVINNVVASSNSNAVAQTNSDAADFIAKYTKSGAVDVQMSTLGGATLKGYVDTDGDNIVDSNELVDTLTIDSKFAANWAVTSTQGLVASEGSAYPTFQQGNVEFTLNGSY